MSFDRPAPHRDNLSTILLTAVVAVRGWLIVSAALWTPHGLGGLFLAFADAISGSRYRLPVGVPYYSEGGLPFAYPPAAFYAIAIITDVFKVPTIVGEAALVVIASALSLLVFFAFARRMRLSESALMGACTVLALMPAAYVEQFEIAGLAEAVGSVAIIVFALSLLIAYERSTARDYVLAGIAWAFCVLSSPGSAYGSVVTALIYAVALLRKDPAQHSVSRNLQMLVLMGLVGATVSAPYWLTVAAHHGIGIFTRSFGAQHGNPAELFLAALTVVLRFSVAGGPLGFVTDVLILGGLMWAFSQRRWWLIAWCLGLLLIPREGRWLVTIPAAILGGIGLTEALIALGAAHGKAGRLVGFAVVATSLTLNTLGAVMSREASYDSELWTQAEEAMDWVKGNTSANTTFIVLGDQYIREWVPYVAERTVLNVWWGQEWEPEEQRVVGQLNEALAACYSWECVCSNVDQFLGHSEFMVFLEAGAFPYLEPTATDDVRFSRSWRNEAFVVGSLTCTP